ncbi:uncharacterized protein LOC110709068 [Chenopodium quinoa]|uniref:uncharacterized protein LOC110709068 n=1 Tax=Chenopodium quinoa TaxID=63459 RepID=UPI000B7926B9|nr:uncharacterized protein LOC110709068 [Chenopodium quinoa]
MTKEVQEIWVKKGVIDGVLRLHCSTEIKVYPVQFRHVFTGLGKFETILGEGWREYVTSNSLQMEDRIQLVLEDNDGMLYRVRIWHDEKEITVVDSMEYVPMEVFFLNHPLLNSHSPRVTLTNLESAIQNILLPFDRAHFHSLKDRTPVELYVTWWWKTTMRIKFDTNKKIVTFNVKKGVSEMIAGEVVELSEKSLVELEGMEPLVLSITFT